MKNYRKILNLLNKIRKEYNISDCYATDVRTGDKVVITGIYKIEDNCTRVVGHTVDKNNYYEFGRYSEDYSFDVDEKIVNLNYHLGNIKEQLYQLKREIDNKTKGIS